VDTAVRERYLQIIEERAKCGRNGAAWQADTVHALEERGLDRVQALSRMLVLYCEGMHSNEPVHTWPVPRGAPRHTGHRHANGADSPAAC
jgi:hypothetical protein